MDRWRRLRPWLLAGALALTAGPPALAAAVADNPASLLAQADRIKSNDQPGFVRLLRQLDADAATLSRPQKELLQYLHGWEAAYLDDSAQAIKTWRELSDHAGDANLRLRATSSLVNELVNGTQFAEAYALQDRLLTALPQVRDLATRTRIMVNAALLYANAGQDALALDYANRILTENPDDFAGCQAQYLRMRVLSAQPGNAFASNYPDALTRCIQADQPLYTDSIRVFAAQRALADGQPELAIQTLQPYLAEARATGFSDLVDDFEAILAQAAWTKGDRAQARAHALHAVHARANTVALVRATRVLYEIAKADGDLAAALAWYEKSATTDKGYLDDISARAIAYQKVHQQVVAKESQMAAVDQQNQLLMLKQEVDRKSLLAVRLGIALLLVVLGSVLLYALRTRRARLRFQQLAQRDGLTGIHNRPHFIECAQAELANCRKSMREVGVIAIDLDHFKQINDRHGHAAGDDALKAAVAACRKHLRSVDIFGRLGGEEFGILLPDCVPERAADVAEAMRREIAALQGTADGPAFPVSASFGVGASRWAGYALGPLLAQADSALYCAKRDGRNRVVVHADASHAEVPDDREAG